MATAFSVGLLATTNPCFLPLYPDFLAYVSATSSNSQGRALLGGLVLSGVLSMMLLLGGVIALLEVSVGSTLAVVVPLADLAVVAIGLLLLLGRSWSASSPCLSPPDSSWTA